MTTLIYNKITSVPEVIPDYNYYVRDNGNSYWTGSSEIVWALNQPYIKTYVPPQSVVDIRHHYDPSVNSQDQLVLTLKPAQNQDLMDLHNDNLYVNRDNWRMFCHLFRNEAETDQHRLESLKNCYQLDVIHWIYQNYSQLQSRLAFENMTTVRGMVRQVSDLMASQFVTFDKTSGLYSLHPNYTTIAKAEMTRGKLKGRLEHDKTLDEPKLKWDMTPEQFMTAFMTPPPATILLYIDSINNRGGTPATAELTVVNTRPNAGTIKWQQKLGSIWTDLPDATGTSYTPPTTQDLVIRAVATGYLDLDGEVIPDIASNELSIQR